jgi:hypothetical protein
MLEEQIDARQQDAHEDPDCNHHVRAPDSAQLNARNAGKFPYTPTGRNLSTATDNGKEPS